MLKIGLIINPYAGIGGRVGLKGSDGDAIREQAFKLGAEKLAQQKTANALEEILDLARQKPASELMFLTASGEMGENLCQQLQLNYQVVYQVQQDATCEQDNSSQSNHSPISTAQDTQNAVLAIQKATPDLLLFAGGDGTARDVYQVIEEQQVVLGIPAGVKIHSGVYAVSAQAAGLLVRQLIQGGLINLSHADVVDLDEDAFRQGQVKSRKFGEMLILDATQYMQAVKQASHYHQEQNLDDIAAYVIEEMQEDVYYVVGSGTSCAFIMQQLGLENTLLGSDIILNGQLEKPDAREKDFLDYLDQAKPLHFIITVIGGQGHLLGRGNHQISPQVVNKVGWENFTVIASEEKIKGLQGRPLLVDSGDKALDKQLAGRQKVIIGYRNQILYPLGFSPN